jgi:hypothetical protein
MWNEVIVPQLGAVPRLVLNKEPKKFREKKNHFQKDLNPAISGHEF